ncbi:hypothetical protein I2492_04005 [Budviciaceae bacterium CWB-B4]|uniref:Uncharacterized protein n=1 Tax=Limnobaculum xujianqingii TaxID=2738837 RepID=A0A9D7FRF1_9GAMM|nr:hypothetical protein [Limnobaculum xujianqingii]MBK5072179.1 hypothetical protein [Limnobaculum xujianqingii]MBK5175488.1 hypothetical protein [Limnobaculum xujianqingii]
MNKGIKESVEMKPEEACKEGEAANDEGAGIYENRKNASKSEAVKNDLELKKKTITTAHVTLAKGKSLLMRAISCYSSMTASTRKFFVLGQKPKKRPEGIFLCQSSYGYDADNDYHKTCNGGHTEARILANLALSNQLAGAKIVFNINWNDESKLPCQHCFDMICKTASDEECDAKIFICTEDNEPVDMNKECKKSNSDYDKFKRNYTRDYG